MRNKDFIPRRDVDFNHWAIAFTGFLAGSYERFGLPAEVYEGIMLLYREWTKQWGFASSPQTRTKAAVLEKTYARNAFEKELRMVIREFLIFNRRVNDVDRENMGIPVHKTTRTSVPAPATVPKFHTDSSILRRLSIHFRDQGSTLRAKPAGVFGVEVRWDFGDSPPASVEAFVHTAFCTRPPLTLVFDDSQRGKTIYICLRWENMRGEKGPWSEMVNAVVP